MQSSTHKRKAAQFIFLGFSLLVVMISAITSFSFFYTYFDTLIPATVLDESIRGIISGFIGVMLFDVAAVIWLNTYLNHSETSEQRAISLAMTIVTFLGAAMASVAYLSLNARGEMAIDGNTLETIGLVALIVVIGGIVANFGAAQMHSRFSLENKRAVQESDQRDILLDAEFEQQEYLTKLVAQSVKEKLAALAPDLAENQAEKIATRFHAREDAKHASGANKRVSGSTRVNRDNTITAFASDGNDSAPEIIEIDPKG